MNYPEVFHELVESSADIVIITDVRLRTLYASPAAFRLLDVPPGDMNGITLVRLFDSETVCSWQHALRKSQHVCDFVPVTVAGDQKFYFDVEVSALHRSVEALVIRMHDNTAQKLREKELVKANSQLDQVIYKTTHDLKAPLHSALGLVNLIERSDGNEREEYVALIKKSLLRLDGYISEMNNFFRNEKLAVRREEVCMSSLFREELANLQALPGQPDIAIQLDVRAAHPFYSDSIRVRTIVGNLLSNAIKYHDPDKKKPFINIAVSIDEDSCDIRIADNGIGIAEEYLEKIFELFFRATDRSKGTGLGLFIVRDTINKLDGKIEVHSIFGEGTTFNIKLPNRIGQPIMVE